MSSLLGRSLIAAALAASAACGDNLAATDASSEETTLGIDLTLSDLGAVDLGVGAEATFTIANRGTEPSGSIAARLQGDAGFSVERNDCATLAPGATCQIVVRFAPTSAGAKAATLRVSSSPGGVVSARLTGQGVEPGPTGAAPSEITLTPSSLAENQPLGTTVGMLGAVDADVGDAFAFSLVPGTGGANNASFVIAGSELRTADLFDRELQSSYSIRVLVTDSDGQQLEQALAIAITNVDEPPTATADGFSVAEDSGATALDVMVNDDDADGGPMVIGSVTQPANGAVVITGDGAGVTYAPAANYVGDDAFTYMLNGGSTATVSISVTGADDLPLAVADAATVAEDSDANAIDVLVNDDDADGGPMVIGSVTQPANGAVVITGDGTGATYAPAGNYAGPDAFTYTLNGGSTATVSVTVTAVDDLPVAVADAATVVEDSGANAIDVLANDTDLDAGPLMVASVTQPEHGTVVIIGGGTGLTYAPAANHAGADGFTYTLNGGSTAMVAMTVTGADDLPVAVADAATVAEDSGPNAVDVLANDTDIDAGPTSIASVTQPANGAVVITGGGAGLTYAPATNHAGADAFTYALNGGSTATVSITVTAADDLPVAVADAATMAEDSGPNAVDVLANDTDVDAGPTSIASVTQPANGTVVITGGGTGLTYAPAANHAGADAFTYTLNGGSTATVSIAVTGADDLPVAVADAATVAEDSGTSAVDVLANDTDIDAGPTSIASVTQPASGAVVITGGGTGLTYAPAANHAGLDAFTYTLNGGSTATVSITVTGADDLPIAVADAATVVEDSGANTIDVLANDTDIDDGPTSIASVTQPASGAVVITGGGTGLTYAPAANHAGPDAFTYTLNGGSTATVAMTVTGVDDLPVAVADASTVVEDSGANTVDVLANDTDDDAGPTSIASVTQASNGAAVITGGGTGVTYAPAANYAGPDAFTYTLNGGSTATVSVTVTAVDDLPVAVADAATVLEDSGATPIDVLANDTDVDAGPTSIASITQAADGAVVITDGGAGLTYAPGPELSGTDTFTYTLNGGSTATVTVTVDAVDDPPVAVDDAASVVHDSAASTIFVLANDSDVDGGPMSIASATDPANGVVVVAMDGLSLTYTPQAGYCNLPPGTVLDSFAYTLAPGGSVGDVLVTVACPPPPLAQSVSPSAGHVEGGTLVVITGTELEDASAVMFDGNPGTIEGNTATAITVTTPSGAAGSVDVVVTTPDGSSTITGGFTYTELSQTAWTSIGPSPILNGQTQQTPLTAPVSGRVAAIAVDPTDSNKVYLGAASGGVWRSLDGGASWAPIFDTAQSLAIGALALAPSDPTILYVGTGEANNSSDSFFGVGVYRIDDVDTTATLVGPMNPSFTFSNGSVVIATTCFGGRAISRIVVHPTDPATIFVSTAAAVSGIAGNAVSNLFGPIALRGVYRSTNATADAGSVAFAKLTVNTDSSGDVPATGNTSVFDMALEPGNPDNLLVTTSGGTTGGAVYRSTNALAPTPTFTQTLFPGYNGLVMKLAITKVGAVVTVYVTSNEPVSAGICAGQAGRLRKSVNGGITFGVPLPAAEGFCGNQCSYDNPVGVDPNDASVVYLGGNERGVCSDVMKRSADGGATFTRDDTGLFRDSHAFFFDPLTTPTTVWTGNDGGIAKRQDAAAGTAWSNQNTAPLNTLQFQSIAVHPTDPYFTLGGAHSNGTLAQRTSSGNWVAVEGNSGGFALIDQSSVGTESVTMYHTKSATTNTSIGFYRTNLGACLDSKDSWAFRGAGPAANPAASCDGSATSATNGIILADIVLLYPPMALGPATPNTLYFGTNKLYRSVDKGDTMTAVSQVLVASVAISAIGISPQNDNVRIVGMRNGTVFGTTTGASPLANLAFPFPVNANASTTNRHISRAVIDPVQANTAYVTLSYYTSSPTAGQVWRTTNLNAAPPTWTSISSGLPNVPVNAFAADASDPTFPGVTVLYAGTDTGVYRSSDGGASWATFGLGLPRVPVFDMAIQPTRHILRIATHGRGMWETQLANGPSIAGLTPSIGPIAGGTTVVISGTNLWTTTSVLIGGAAATIIGRTATTVTVTTAPGAAGPADVEVVTVHGSATATAAYTYDDS